MKRKFIILVLFLNLIGFLSFAQPLPPPHPEIISTGGDYFVGNGLSISWTIGEPVIETFVSTNKAVVLTQGFQQPNLNGYMLDGYLTYDNKASTPVTSTWVYLYNAESAKFDSAQTNATGYFNMVNIPNGTYTLKFKTTKAWLGANPIDALKVNRDYIKLYTFKDNIMKIAADVNADGKINPTDALTINRRYIKLISSFKAGNWAFENPTITINNANVTQNVKSLCFGDVAGSDTPPLKMMSQDVLLNNQGILIVENNKEFELPISVTRDLTLGAFGLIVTYPSENLKVIDVTSDVDGLVYNIMNGEVRVAWSDEGSNGYVFKNNDHIIKLKMVAMNMATDKDVQIDLAPESVIADTKFNNLIGEVLTAPKIGITQDNTSSGYYLSQNYPNPFKNSTIIDYNLPEAASVSLKVFDLLGNEIADLANGQQTSGFHQVTFNISNLADGVYLYKFDAKGAATSYNKTRMMVVN